MEKTNNKAIVSLTLGVLSIIIPYIGLILGIIGLIISSKSIKEIDQTNEKGRGLAISGRVCSIVGICFQFLLILIMVLSISMFVITDPSV
ncbi:hypothetical protein ABE28_019695 [Peribacillus muralis]|uniref:DUF4190 domain-containing protein n=1 Tax=Peribacillus muralis TaxID=264697 RepID=A0A1B3XTP5_9BACI|nr:DUF4190 domain-containing protein [Peribacillus muralis]AOH56597.1 hypothetical protein ABE28_019695 [Peribacillus muralis]